VLVGPVASPLLEFVTIEPVAEWAAAGRCWLDGSGEQPEQLAKLLQLGRHLVKQRRC